MSMLYEYKVLGKADEQVSDPVGTRPVSFHYAMDHEHNGLNTKPQVVQQVLNSLATEGWEPVSLDFPYVFRRVRANQ